MVTMREFDSFKEFAVPLINSGNATSMLELLEKWQAQREHEAVMEDIRQGIEDAEAGLGKPAEEVFAEARRRLGIDP